jgi:ribulose-bisphosphate carboxylase small chain
VEALGFNMTRIGQGNFALISDLTNDQIQKQIEYGIKKGYAISVEWTDDPHPRNCYWEMWGLPLFNIPDSAAIMYELNECRKAHPNTYIKINGFSAVRGIESTAMSFIVQRPLFEPGFYLTRQEGKGRNIIYTLNSYAVQSNTEGHRYQI